MNRVAEKLSIGAVALVAMLLGIGCILIMVGAALDWMYDAGAALWSII